jgi:hypothetical protein
MRLQFRYYAGGTFPIIDGDLNVLFDLAHHEIDRRLNFDRSQSREASLTTSFLPGSVRTPGELVVEALKGTREKEI